MIDGKGKGSLVEKQALIHIAVLVAVALVIGVYLIVTTVLISKDGTMYVDYARGLSDKPLETILDTPSPPGYPFLISLSHKICGLFYQEGAIDGWIISAQFASLACKLIATAALYLIGCYLFGAKVSFIGVLILSILPDSAKFGSDALSDWPHLMFLSLGFLFLLLGARQHDKTWLFGLAGVLSGLGYLVRSECGQIVLYGGLWFLFNFIRPTNKIKRYQSLQGLFLILLGFAIIALPYMLFEGYVFPKQGFLKIPKLLGNIGNLDSLPMARGIYMAGFAEKIFGDNTFIPNLCETLMYYFVPGFLIGIYYYFRKLPKTFVQTFFAAAFISMNFLMLFWQVSYRGILSRRHTFTLVAFTIFYVVVGLRVISTWLSNRFSKDNSSTSKSREDWFRLLMVIGVIICLPKLLLPLRIEKQGYREAAMWLRNNTSAEDIVIVPDKRLGFYAERRWVEEFNKDVKVKAQYRVKVIRDGDNESDFNGPVEEKYSVWLNKWKKKKRVVIYKLL
ncbi:MAG: glycosyltransferase family 39 protein [Planctomycetes bacterium]|nr:glycosyltransferase family 39 protein [Planctomycetota bacterium]